MRRRWHGDDDDDDAGRVQTAPLCYAPQLTELGAAVIAHARWCGV